MKLLLPTALRATSVNGSYNPLTVRWCRYGSRRLISTSRGGKQPFEAELAVIMTESSSTEQIEVSEKESRKCIL